MKCLSPLLILLLLPACSLSGPDDGELTARTQGQEVILKNETSERVYYFVVGRTMAARINWIQSLDPTHSVAADGERRISYDDIFQEEGGEQEALVYWWRADRQGDADEPGKLNYIVVALE